MTFYIQCLVERPRNQTRLLNHCQSMKVITASAEITLDSSAAFTSKHSHRLNCGKLSLLNSKECSMVFAVSQKRVCSVMVILSFSVHQAQDFSAEEETCVGGKMHLPRYHSLPGEQANKLQQAYCILMASSTLDATRPSESIGLCRCFRTNWLIKQAGCPSHDSGMQNKMGGW